MQPATDAGSRRREPRPGRETLFVEPQGPLQITQAVQIAGLVEDGFG